jgi:hypothetical protein
LGYTIPRQLLEKIDDGDRHDRRKEHLLYHLPVAATSKAPPVGFPWLALMPNVLGGKFAAALRVHNTKDSLSRLNEHNGACV